MKRVVIILIANILGFAMGTCAFRLANAEPGPVMFVADLNQPAIEVPAAFAAEAGSIVQCESRWRADAVSPTGDYGLFQLNRRWQEKRANAMGYGWSQMFDPTVNTLVAVAIWESWGQTFKAWSCATKQGVR